MNSNDRRTALVTGGSRGIGRGIALALAQRGYDVAIGHWNDRDRARQIAETMRGTYGCRCEVFETNLAEESEAERLAEDVLSAFSRVEALVNNAGITRFQPIPERLRLCER